MRPPETTRVGFSNPRLRRSPRLAGLAQQWLQDYSREHYGNIRSITLIMSGEPPKIERWVELPNLLESEAKEVGVVMVPKSLIDKFSKPLDFRTTKC